MTILSWDNIGERVYETGVDRGVMYLANAQGVYAAGTGTPWNGLVSVTESPSGAESSKQYADNGVYVNLVSAEDFSATLEAFTYPEQFAVCDGTASPSAGVYLGQQPRRSFGLAYRTRIGNDLVATDFGYKLHLVYNAMAAPTEKAYSTINDSPEAATFSWELSTTPVAVPGYKPTAIVTIDSTKVNAAKLLQLENLLYGTAGTDASLPTPAEIIALFANSQTAVATVTAPTYTPATKTIAIPNVAGVEYQIDGVKKTGNVVITKDTVVTAKALPGYRLPDVSDDDWFYAFA